VTVPILAEAPPIREAGGALRVGQTAVTLESVVWAFQQGSTPEDIVDQFPTLAIDHVYAVIAYYLRHRDEVDRYLTAQEERHQEGTESLLREIPETQLQARMRARRQR